MTVFLWKMNGFLWGAPALVLILTVGLFLSARLRFVQLTLLPKALKRFCSGLKSGRKDSGFQAFCTALAATIGTGNIAGVSAAIVIGGPGAVFWMWIAAFFGMMTNYSENVLGIYYRRKVDGEWAGGAMYYLKDGLGAKKGFKTIGRILAVLFACFAVLASFGIGNMGQINKIVVNLESAFPIAALSDVVLYEGVTLYSLLIGVTLLILAAVKRCTSI